MKKIRKIIALCLVMLIMSAAFAPAYAAESEACPVIHIRGIASSDIYADKDDPSTLIEVPDAQELIAFVQENIIPALLLYSVGRDSEALAKDITSAINDSFSDWFNNEDGTPTGNSGTIMNYPSADSIKTDSKLNFEYDWRGDPFVIASELDAFIDYVIASSGAEKVAITCHSLGSVVALTYLTVYGDSDICGLVLDTPAAFGVSSVGELISGKVKFNNDSLTYFLKFMLGEEEYDEFMASLVDVFELAGIPEMFSVFVDTIMEQIGPTVYKETLAPLFGQWLTIWTMVPDEMLDETMDYYFNELSADKDYSALKAKIEAYNSTVRAYKEETLQNFDEQGKIAVISRHGYASLPFENTWSLIGDSVIETRRSSIGAVTAPAGDYFDDEYLEGKDMKYISPDKTIDASACLFPDKTWFINNAKHQETYITSTLYNSFLFSDEELTCDTSEIDRFSYYDKENGTIVKDTSAPEKIEEPSKPEILFNFIKSFLVRIYEFFVKLFKK